MWVCCQYNSQITAGGQPQHHKFCSCLVYCFVGWLGGWLFYPPPPPYVEVGQFRVPEFSQNLGGWVSSFTPSPPPPPPVDKHIPDPVNSGPNPVTLVWQMSGGKVPVGRKAAGECRSSMGHTTMTEAAGCTPP